MNINCGCCHHRKSNLNTYGIAMGGQPHRSTTSASSSSPRSFFSSFCSAALRRKSIELTPTSSANTGGLERHLGPFELVLLGIGASIGAGIFVVTGTVARDAGPGEFYMISLRLRQLADQMISQNANIFPILILSRIRFV